MNGNNFKSGVATEPFMSWFRYFYKDIEVVKNVSDYDLIIFTGGSDISPEIYGQENTYSYTSLKRDRIELNILKSAIELNKKILGVCRGHQLINAYLGGILAQDLEKVLNTFHEGSHELEFKDGNSLVKECFSDENVNSLHHQGVISPGKTLEITSTYNKVIESTESENIISVQFHPELSDSKNSKVFFNRIEEWALGI